MRNGKLRPRMAYLPALVTALSLVTSCTAAMSAPVEQTRTLPDARSNVSASPTGWTTVWRDDFTGPAGSAISSKNWQHDVGTCYPGCRDAHWGNEQLDTATDSTRNVALDGEGHLLINAVNTDGNWTSGRIETRRDDFRVPPHGVMRIEGRIKMPDVDTVEGNGYWPAFWMLGQHFRDAYRGWPGVGEIDIAESITGRPSMVAAMHCGQRVGGSCAEPTGLAAGERPCPDCGKTFHTYAVEIDYSSDPQEVRWYLDGKQFFTVRADQMNEATWRAATDHGFFIILNLAIGGRYPAAIGGRPDKSTASNRPLRVDYVSVSTRNN